MSNNERPSDSPDEEEIVSNSVPQPHAYFDDDEVEDLYGVDGGFHQAPVLHGQQPPGLHQQTDDDNLYGVEDYLYQAPTLLGQQPQPATGPYFEDDDLYGTFVPLGRQPSVGTTALPQNYPVAGRGSSEDTFPGASHGSTEDLGASHGNPELLHPLADVSTASSQPTHQDHSGAEGESMDVLLHPFGHQEYPPHIGNELQTGNETAGPLGGMWRMFHQLGSAVYSKRGRDSEEGRDVKRAKTVSEVEQEYKDQIKNLQQQVQALTAEKEELVDRINCKVCMERQANMLLWPCRHLVTCEPCYNKIRRSRNSACPVCQKRITKATRVFLP